MKFIRIILLIINIFVAFLLLVTLSVAYISPKTLPFSATWALFFPYLLLINATFFVLWLVFWRRQMLVSLAVLLLSIPAIRKSYPIFSRQTTISVETKTDTIKMLTYNTMSSFGYQKFTPDSKNCGYQYILDQDADIVCLQEFNVSNSDHYFTENDVNTYLKKYRYKYLWYREKNSPRKSGMAVFSKFPIKNEQHIDLNSSYNSAFFTDIEIHGETYRVFNVHLESNKVTIHDFATKYQVHYYEFNSENIKDLTKLMSKKLSEAAVIRASQVELLSKMIKKSPYKVIVCGDFNDVPLSYAHHKMLGNLRDSFIEAGKGLGLTYCNNIYRLRIDYILHDKHLAARDFVVDKVKFSDHYPAHCKLILPRE